MANRKDASLATRFHRYYADSPPTPRGVHGSEPTYNTIGKWIKGCILMTAPPF